MPAKSTLIQQLVDLGKLCEFEVLTEVEASESAWVDVVWFDKRLPVQALRTAKPKMRYAPVLPVVAFEVEVHTGLNAKHVKGSVSNLNNLGAQLGVIVIGKENLLELQKRHIGKNEKEVDKILRDRIYRWIYAEAQPHGRIIVMFEEDAVNWIRKLEVIRQKLMAKEETK